MTQPLVPSPIASNVAPVRLVVAVLIARADGAILLAQRGDGRRHPGQWEFPGGKVEAGEDPRDALARECEEELGCTVEVGAIYEAIYHHYPDSDPLLLLFYTARVIGGEASPVEHARLEWLTPEAMESFDLLEADRPLPAYFSRRFPAFMRGISGA